MLPIFLQPGPAYGIDNGQRAMLARRDSVTDGHIIEINRVVHEYLLKLFGVTRTVGVVRSLVQFTQYLRVVFSQPGRRSQSLSQNAGNGSLGKLDRAELRMIDLCQKAARDELGIVDQIE